LKEMEMDKTVTVKTPGTWTAYTTSDAEKADELIHEHLECAIIDTESIDFSCYTHEVSVRWIG